MSKIFYVNFNRNKPFQVEEIRIVKFNLSTHAIVKFSNIFICKGVMNHLKNNENNYFRKNLNNFNKNSSHTLDINYIYDITDLKNSEWYAIILRNLETAFHDINQIKEICEKIHMSNYIILPPQKIFSSLCSLIVVEDLDIAENVCINLNKFSICFGFSSRKLKAHIHPKSSKIRLNPEKSHFSVFLNSQLATELKPEDQSEVLKRIHENNKRLMELEKERGIDIVKESGLKDLPLRDSIRVGKTLSVFSTGDRERTNKDLTHSLLNNFLTDSNPNKIPQSSNHSVKNKKFSSKKSIKSNEMNDPYEENINRNFIPNINRFFKAFREDKFSFNSDTNNI